MELFSIRIQRTFQLVSTIESSGGVPPGDLHTEGTHYGGALKTAKF